jgi:hypothetical protein
MSSNNPLQQYFRRPSLYLKLPSLGIGYPANAIDLPDNKELPVYPMTAIDEITTRTPDALFNGTAVVDLIKSCVPNIKDPWCVLQSDIDAILLAIKIASNGNTMEMSTVCPSCQEDNKYDVELSGLLAKMKAGDYQTLVDVNGLKIKFKALNYKKINETSTNQFNVQFELNQIQKMEEGPEKDKQSSMLVKKMNALAMDLVLDSIEYIKTDDATVIDKNYIQEFLANCDIKTYDFLKEKTISLRQESESKPLKFKCISCGHEYEQPFNINVSDFFD